MKKAFIVVGHSNWGKSATLKAFTDGDTRTRYMKLPKVKPGFEAYVRRISNDDDELSLVKFSKDFAHRLKEEILIMTLCPDFTRLRTTADILKNLQESFTLYFLVLENKFKGTAIITGGEINRLRQFGEVEIVQKRPEAAERALRLQKYIRQNV